MPEIEFTPTTTYTKIDDDTVEVNYKTRIDKNTLLVRQAHFINLRDKRKQHHDDVAQPELDKIEFELSKFI